MKTWEVTFHDSHTWDEACEGCDTVSRVQADDPKSAAIQAFLATGINDEPEFDGFVRDPCHWASPAPNEFYLNTQESECELYPLSVRKVRFPQ